MQIIHTYMIYTYTYTEIYTHTQYTYIHTYDIHTYTYLAIDTYIHTQDLSINE